ncbi:hypothetical protein B6A09_1605 [Saccharomyces cerevisiae synthetic construct]|uniref:Putative uncharacterized protein YBR191W-A n=2 Tax=Saccharomyces cerevisiae TaxID=4932 RepID=YB191_YEAST|nr:RecName: Full=Putative uncharacterized protein YBR191W-A [Saccharomyces cerevisiae S288C]ARB01996.1 hypothetical protein B6A09_1605 [Saccharomyces cerevisiae synthetic construct]EWG87758.1 hypothetical protein R008_B12131 [Saccharomyces cerevisiae R008]EWG97384.1 hypothetical protein R103_B50496 [Saccharomyces cerevisiae R103]KZV13273.1 hypothetical protein WN66_00462 [Saccharomyces cerevisiae]CBK39265.1 EC1118_1B15_3565p [Saccharomyces cerevisiae EC1118]
MLVLYRKRFSGFRFYFLSIFKYII